MTSKSTLHFLYQFSQIILNKPRLEARSQGFFGLLNEQETTFNKEI